MCNNNRIMPMNPTIKEQILEVRETGRTNMFDVNAVQRIAYELDLYDLVCYLDDENNKKQYCNFILYGDGE